MTTLLRRSARGLRESVLWVGALLGGACLLAALSGYAFGVSVLVFQSGSMAPTYEAGALGIARTVPADSLAVGDVVTVGRDDDSKVTHRVVDIDSHGEAAVLTLQGDANDVADQVVYTVTEADRVVFGIPRLGQVVVFAMSPPGLVAGGVLVAVVLFLGFGPQRRPDEGGPGKRKLIAAASVVVLALPLAAGQAAEPTEAFWTDQADATSGELTAYVVPPPPATTCSVTGNSLTGFTATIRWSAVTSPVAFGYTAVLRQTGANLTVTSPNASTRQVQVSSSLLGSLFGSTVHVDIRSTIPGTAWVSEQRRTRALTVALLGANLTCGGDSVS